MCSWHSFLSQLVPFLCIFTLILNTSVGIYLCIEYECRFYIWVIMYQEYVVPIYMYNVWSCIVNPRNGIFAHTIPHKVPRSQHLYICDAHCTLSFVQYYCHPSCAHHREQQYLRLVPPHSISAFMNGTIISPTCNNDNWVTIIVKQIWLKNQYVFYWCISVQRQSHTEEDMSWLWTSTNK